MGQFWAVLVWMADRRECSRGKIVSQRREQARRVYYGVVLEAKKEIPDDTRSLEAKTGMRPFTRTFSKIIALAPSNLALVAVSFPMTTTQTKDLAGRSCRVVIPVSTCPSRSVAQTNKQKAQPLTWNMGK
jgi:hypothetical protein